MGIWDKFLDWLLGRKLMSVDDLKAIQKASLECLQNKYNDMNERIDIDDDGMVSVREAWTLFKETLSILKALIKEVI